MVTAVHAPVEGTEACAEDLIRVLRDRGYHVEIDVAPDPRAESIVDHVCALPLPHRDTVRAAMDHRRGHVEAPFLTYREARAMAARASGSPAPWCALRDEVIAAEWRHRRLRLELLAGALLGLLAFAVGAFRLVQKAK